MSLTNVPLEIPTQTELNLVYKQVGIDADKAQNAFEMVKEWLKCESYLPSDIDETLLKNFVISSKGNLERAKEKLEKYLVAKTKITYLYTDRVLKKDDFSIYPYHRSWYISPNQTPEQNRILIYRIPLQDPTNFDHHKFAKYMFLFFDVLLLNDTSAGYHFIYDVGYFSPQYLGKLNLRVIKQSSELMYNIIPFRIRSLLVLNETPTLNIIMNLGKMFMSKKLKERISAVKVEDLLNYHPKDCLPIEYGGTQGHFNDASDKLLEVLTKNEEWCKDTEKLKLAGPVPEHKQKYSFEDFQMDGSFRQLTID